MEEICQAKCKKYLECGHIYEGTCSEFNGNNALKCIKPCERLKKCNHKCFEKCWEDCDVKKCQEKVFKKLRCGHEQESECFLGEMCQAKCTKNLDCGHIYEGVCCDDVLISCNNPCFQKLDCGHICKGTCGSCFLGTLHIPCEKPCEKNLECGHKCIKLCGEYCGLCFQICETVCFCHKTRCKNYCYDSCEKCTRKCSFSCEHQQCTLLCNEICIIKPCNKRCEKILPECGHQCSGLCGEMCPSRCLNCDSVVKGEKEIDLPIIQMKCNHIITVKELDFLMETQALSYFVCSECSIKTPIEYIKRYQNILKKQRNKYNDKKEFEKNEILEKYKGNMLVIKFNCILFNRQMKDEILSKLKDIEETKNIYFNPEIKKKIQKLKDTYICQGAIDMNAKQWNMIKNKIIELTTMKDL